MAAIGTAIQQVAGMKNSNGTTHKSSGKRRCRGNTSPFEKLNVINRRKHHEKPAHNFAFFCHRVSQMESVRCRRFAASRRCQITKMQNANSKKCSILSYCGRVASVTNSQSVACRCPCLHCVVAIFYLQFVEWDNWGTVPANICNELINCRERFAKGEGKSKGGAVPGECVLWQEGIVYFSQSWSCCSTWNEKRSALKQRGIDECALTARYCAIR